MAKRGANGQWHNVPRWSELGEPRETLPGLCSGPLAARARGVDALRVLVVLAFFAQRVRCLLCGALVCAPLAPVQQEATQAPPSRPAHALPQQFARAEDVTASGLGFVELGAARDTYLLGEPFTLHLRFGFERELLRTGLVQLFQRPLDVPAQVFAPALERLDGALFLDASEPEMGASFALGEKVTRAAQAADVERDGRTYAVFEYERQVAATRPGELRLAAPLLGFARATRFAQDFVLGSVPLDRRDELVHGVEARITILPLPEQDRPAEFTGAIGRYTIHATAEPRELVAGTSLALTVRIEAEASLGDLSQCAAPSLEGLAGFHVRGSLLERDPLRLTARHDLVPLDAGVASVPPIRFAFFDVTPPAGYRTIETQPIALVVHPAEASSTTSTIPTPSSGSPSAQPRPFAWIAALVLAGLALGFWVRRARK